MGINFRKVGAGTKTLNELSTYLRSEQVKIYTLKQITIKKGMSAIS